MDNGHVLLKCLSGFSTSLIRLVEHMDKHLQSSLGVGFLHQMLDHVDAGKQYSLASPRQMRKQAMFDRIIFGTVRWVMGDANFHPDLIR